MSNEKCTGNNVKGSDRCLIKGNIKPFNTSAKEIHEKP
jgi:hypothetical protein